MKKNLFALLLGILIIGFLFSRIGFEKILNLFLDIKIQYFLAALVAYFLVEVVGSLTLRTVIKAKFIDLLPSHMCGMFLSTLTPGRVGYYYTAYSLSKKTKYSTSENVGYLTMVQGLSFLVKVFLCMAAILYFSSFLISSLINYFIIVSLVPLIFLVGFIILLYTKIPYKVVKRFPCLEWTKKYVIQMQKSVKNLSRKKILIIIVMHLIAWVLTGFQWFLITMALNIHINFLTALMLQPLLTTIMFVPFTPSGFGIAESGSALLFEIIGFSSAIGVTFLLLQRMSLIMVDSISLIDLRIHKISLKKIKDFGY